MSDYTLEDVEQYLAQHPVLTPTDPAQALGDVASDTPDPVEEEPAGEPDPEAPGESEPPAEEPGNEGEQEGEPEIAGDDPPAALPPEPPVEQPPSELTPDELAQLVALRDTIKSDPGLQQRIVEHYVGTQATRPPAVAYAPAPALGPAAGYLPPAAAFPSSGPKGPEQPDPTGALDLDDPQIAALYGLVQQQQSAIQQLAVQQATARVQQEAALAAQSEALLNRAVSQYQSEHGIADSDMPKLRDVAGRLGVLPSLMSGTDPVTGLPCNPDPLVAISRALDIARSMMPDMAAAPLQRQAQQARAVNHRKQRLQAVSGSAGSTSRTPPPAPSDPREALLQSVTELYEGQFQDN